MTHTADPTLGPEIRESSLTDGPSEPRAPGSSALKRAFQCLALVGLLLALLTSCKVSSHPVAPSPMGQVVSSDELVARLGEPGPVAVETVVAAEWVVDRAGLINLDHDEAKAHGLTSGDEPIHIAMHVLRHPTRGVYLVDTGVERAFRTDKGNALIRGLVGSAMNVDAMKVHVDTASYLAAHRIEPRGVLLTHLHVDHLTGMRDIPNQVPVYLGPGETEARGFMNLFVQGITDEALEGKGPLLELQYARDPAGRFAGVIDLFGDSSVFALWVPGHTAGSTAYLARTPDGPVLMVGDACHTAWGWEHDVEPGTFSNDPDESVISLRRLRQLVAAHPHISVRLGHQTLPPQPHAKASPKRP